MSQSAREKLDTAVIVKMKFAHYKFFKMVYSNGKLKMVYTVCRGNHFLLYCIFFDLKENIGNNVGPIVLFPEVWINALGCKTVVIRL